MKSFIKKLVIFVCIFLLYSLPALIFKADKNFYNSIKKPFYAPKPIYFSIIWSVLYLIFSVYLAIKLTNKNIDKEAKISFIMNYIVSFFFNYVFFNLHNLFLAFGVTFLSFSTGIIIFISLLKKNRYEAAIITPYLIWTLFASVLSAHIYFIN